MKSILLLSKFALQALLANGKGSFLTRSYTTGTSFEVIRIAAIFAGICITGGLLFII